MYEFFSLSGNVRLDPEVEVHEGRENVYISVYFNLKLSYEWFITLENKILTYQYLSR